jgi:phosphoribosyl-AMP cyclohydrolase
MKMFGRNCRSPKPLLYWLFDEPERASPPPTSPSFDGLIQASLRSDLPAKICNRPALQGGLFIFFEDSDMSEVLDFDKQAGLIAAVVQDAKTHRVLMIGYMNREAFDKTIASGHVTFFSRSRQKLWTKGESSGHYLMLKSIATDCDGDALLVEADPIGPGVCHEGYESCFFRTFEQGSWRVKEQRIYDPDAVYGAKK